MRIWLSGPHWAGIRNRKKLSNLSVFRNVNFDRTVLFLRYVFMTIIYTSEYRKVKYHLGSDKVWFFFCIRRSDIFKPLLSIVALQQICLLSNFWWTWWHVNWFLLTSKPTELGLWSVVNDQIDDVLLMMLMLTCS